MTTTVAEQVVRLLADRGAIALTDTAGLIALGTLTVLLIEWQALRILSIEAIESRRTALELSIISLLPAIALVLLARILALLPP